MFTGLVETLGAVRRVHAEGAGRRLTVAAEAIAPALVLGESVAVNGACLTVVAVDRDAFDFQLGPETLQRTNLGEVGLGDAVNLERALRVGDRLGGHLVQGHVDGVGTVLRRERQGDYEFMAFGCAAELTRQMVPKGSVAVDGVSLTLVDVGPADFSVMLIPHTLAQTTLGRKGPGARVNLETDLLAKYVGKALEAQQRQARPDDQGPRS
jgi:riboflavin synthase